MGSSTSILALEVSNRVSCFPIRKTITGGRKWHVENTQWIKRSDESHKLSTAEVCVE